MRELKGKDGKLSADQMQCSSHGSPRVSRVSLTLQVNLDPNWLTLEVNPDGFTLRQILNAIELYERKPLNKRSPKTLRNLVCSYTGQQDIEDDQVKKILELTQSEDPGLGEVAMLLMRQLCLRENNAFKFLFHDGMKHNLDILADKKLEYLHAGAGQVIGKLASHRAFEDLWIEHMMTDGLQILISCLDHSVPQDIQYACAQAFSSLAGHRNLAILILDQAASTIRRIKDINSDFRDVYAEIMTVLAQHTEHTRESILNISSLPEATSMLKQGPCASQRHALTLFATLAEKESGVKALIEAQTIKFIMSALIDSECRHVRCTALTVLHHLLSAPKMSSQKQVLLCIDHFMHSHEEGYSILDQYSFTSHITRPGFRSDPEFKVNRAVEELAGLLIRQLHKEARMEKDKKGGIQEVQLAPGIDIDPVHLQTLTHLTQVLTQMGHLRTFTLKINSMNTQSASKEELRNIMKYSMGRVNAAVVKVLADKGITCLLDLLHVYVIKFNFLARSVLPVTGGSDVTSPEQLKVVLQAWEECMKETKPVEVQLSDIFSRGEVNLIHALLQATLMLAKSTCDNDIQNIEREISDKMEDHNRSRNKGSKTEVKTNGKEMVAEDKKVLNKTVLNSQILGDKNTADASINRNCRCNRIGAYNVPESHVKEFMDRKAKIDLQEQRVKEEPLETISEAGLLFKEALNKELGGLRRLLRIKLYEAGIIETLGPWLICGDKVIKEVVLDALTCLIQPVPDFAQSRPSVPENSPDKRRTRPMSAMTSKERDKALNVALHQMSSTMSHLIKDALGIEPTQETPRKPVTKPPSPKIFTIVENKQKATNAWHTRKGEDQDESATEGAAKKEETTNKDKCLLSDKDEAIKNDFVDEDGLNSAAIQEENSEEAGELADDVLESQYSSKPCQTLSVPRTEGIKENKNLKSYQHQDYDKFARRPSRPQSAKPVQTRPSSAKVALSKRTRPQSAKVSMATRPSSASTIATRPSSASPMATRPSSASTMATRPSSASTLSKQTGVVQKSARTNLATNSFKCTEFNAFNPESRVVPIGRTQRTRTPSLPQSPDGDSSSRTELCVLKSARESERASSTSSDMSGGGKDNGKKSRVKIQVLAARPDSTGAVQIKSIKPSSRKQPTKASWSAKASEAKSRKALEEITRKMRSCVPWKPDFDKYETLRSQCCMRVAEVAGVSLCRDILHKDRETQRRTAVFLQQLVKQSETPVHMKLSECSIIPRLVDYLRINDSKELEEALGLVMARLLVDSDNRLKQLFNHHGGTRLLMAMATYSRGFLREEVTSTLKTVTRGTKSATVIIAGRRRVQSAPVLTGKPNSHPTDIWDKVMTRWKEEDKVAAILRKKTP